MKPPSPWQLASSSRSRRAAAVRYWIVHPLAGGFKIGTHLFLGLMPVDFGSNLGKALGLISARGYKPSEARARRLWRLLHPEAADEPSTDAAMKRLWGNVGRTVAEIALLERIWDEGRAEMIGLEHLAAERAADRPVIVAGLHLGNWEMMSIAGVKNGFHGASLALPLENRFEQRLIGRLRERFGGRMVHATSSSGRAIVDEIVHRGPLVIYIDDHARGRVHAPAFGRPLQAKGNIAYVPRLARMTGASVLLAYCVRQGDAPRFKITISPPIPLKTDGDPKDDLASNIQTLNAMIEPIIAAHVDQWFYALDVDLDE